ncbi:MAG: hypothetical protein ACI3XA_08110 [Clostridia bacterium]
MYCKSLDFMIYCKYEKFERVRLMSTDKAIENAIASVKMEGYQIDGECVGWCKKLMEKEISMEEYIALVKQKSGVIVQ